MSQHASFSFPEASKSQSLGSSLPRATGSLADGSPLASPLSKSKASHSQLLTHRTEESSVDDAGQQTSFNHLLTFPQEIEPVLEDLRDEQKERRLLDHLRNRELGRYLDRLNEELNVASRERMESDVLLDKLNSTRLDAMQQPLLAQLENGFRMLREDLDESTERMRVATEKLYQYEIDAEMERQKLQRHVHDRLDAIQNVVQMWRGIQDEKDCSEGEQDMSRERLLPLEHSDLNPIENSQAQKTIRKELAELLVAIAAETQDRIGEERRQAARAHALTDALRRGLKIVNRSMPAEAKAPPLRAEDEGEEEEEEQ